MRLPFILVFVFLLSASVFPQSNKVLQDLIDSEAAFSKVAASQGTKNAFLDYLDDDGFIFRPEYRNGKSFWNKRPETNDSLSLKTSWADVSSTEDFGYTTGYWEHKTAKTAEKPDSFGQYVNIWRKQTDGKFKILLNIGVSHNQPQENLNHPPKSPADAGKGDKKVGKPFDLNVVTSIFSALNLVNSYTPHLSEEIRLLRDESFPIVGKNQTLNELEIIQRRYPPSSSLDLNSSVSRLYGNFQYVNGTYQLTHKDKTVDKWNFVQIWKYRSGKWQLVLDIFSPVPKNKE